MNYKSVYKLKHILLTIYLQLCHNVLTVIQYYIIVNRKKTKTSRKDLKNRRMKMSYRDVEKVCGDCSHFNACMQGYQTVAPTCCMFDSLYKARKNPEWHHVSLDTLANIDFDMLDEKRKVYLSFYKKWQETRKNLRRCSCGYRYERCRNVFRRSLTIALDNKKISKELVDYFDRQISMVNVECGIWSSAVEVATGQHESHKYNRPTLRH